jgi:hypothetical protein
MSSSRRGARPVRVVPNRLSRLRRRRRLATLAGACALVASAALLTPPAKAAGRTGVLPAVAVTHPFSAAEADHALAGLDLEPATRRELERLLMTVPEPPPAG